MQASEIRDHRLQRPNDSDASPARADYDRNYLLREIAAQLAELNEQLRKGVPVDFTDNNRIVLVQP